MKKRISLLLTAVLLLSLATACSDKAETPETKATEPVETLPAGTLAEEDKAIVDQLKTDSKTLENPTIKWLSFWDINPANGKAMPVELELFSSQYGGKIEYIQTTWDDKFDKLATMVQSGDSPDMFPAADMDVVPRCVLTNLFQPLDDYLDLSSPLWADTSAVNEQYTISGKHYVAATDTDAGVVCIYNLNTIGEYGLPDPATLYAEGNWNWDTFYDMLVKYCKPDEGLYGIDGWWFESAISLSTGVPYIGLDNGKIVQYLDNPLIQKAQDFMAKINKEQLNLPRALFNWKEQPARIGDGTTLFYPVGIWALYEADLSAFGDMEDIMFVPMPKCNDTDEYYVSVGLSAYSLVAGAPNPEGVAAFMECARIAAGSDEVKTIFKKQLFEEYNWSDKMYDMLMTTRELTQKNPVIEFYSAVNPVVAELINNPMKESYNAGASWAQIKEGIRFSLDAELEKSNDKFVQ